MKSYFDFFGNPNLLKVISIVLLAGGMIFEGLMKVLFSENGRFCDGFMGANPQRSYHCKVWVEFFPRYHLSETGIASLYRRLKLKPRHKL